MKNKILTMRRRHLASHDGQQLTLCGHSATIQEFRRMKEYQANDVTCKRCLKLNQKLMKKTDIMEENNREQVKASASI